LRVHLPADVDDELKKLEQTVIECLK
jgi:hypothetical protein